MSSASFGWAPSPSSSLEADLRPEKIRREVFSNPRSQLPGVQSASVVLFQVVDKSSAVLDESSVSPHPDLEYAALPEGVAAPENEAHAISVAEQREQAAFAAGFMIGSVREKTDRVSVNTDGVIGEEDDRSRRLFVSGFDNFQGVQGRVASSERFLGHPVRSIFGGAVR